MPTLINLNSEAHYHVGHIRTPVMQQLIGIETTRYSEFFRRLCAEYATGFATFECSDGGFFAAATAATVSDGIRDMIKTGGADGWIDVYNGYLYGAMDSLFGSDGD